MPARPEHPPNAPPGAAPESAQTLASLLGISKLMIMQTDLGALLNVIMEHAARVTGAERATLYIYSAHSGELTSYIAQDAEIAQIRLPLAGGIAGHVAKTGETVNLEDAYRSPLFDPSWDARTGFRTRSVLCLPMRLPEGRLAGVIQVLNKRRGVFTREDESTLTLFASHAAVAIDNARLHEDLKLVFKSAIGALAEAVDQRDPVTAGHSERVTYYAVRIGRAMGLPDAQLDALECASMLHDIGKIAVPDSILSKADRLTEEEYRVIRRHAASTRDILDQFHFSGADACIPEIAGNHHERLDGSGYPNGLKAAQLSQPSRILAVADVFDAVTSFDRSYRRALSAPDGLALLRAEAGTKLDGDTVEAFERGELYNIERRRFVRIDREFQIDYKILPRDRYSVDTRGGRATTRDISGCGLRFVCDDFIPVGFLLDVNIHLAEADFHFLARTVRTEQLGHSGAYDIGITFLNLSAAAQRSLQRYLVDLSQP